MMGAYWLSKLRELVRLDWRLSRTRCLHVGDCDDMEAGYIVTEKEIAKKVHEQWDENYCYCYCVALLYHEDSKKFTLFLSADISNKTYLEEFQQSIEETCKVEIARLQELLKDWKSTLFNWHEIEELLCYLQAEASKMDPDPDPPQNKVEIE